MTLDELNFACEYNGLTLRSLRVLFFLYHNGGAHHREVRQKFLLCGAAVSRAFDSLSILQLVVRIRPEGDKRDVIAQLTPEGRELIKKLCQKA